jgi:hypothetical protein
VVREAFVQKAANLGELQSNSKLLSFMTAVFPDFERLDFKSYIVAAVGFPPLELLATGFGIALLYTTIFLWLGAIVYQRRDLQ